MGELPGTLLTCPWFGCAVDEAEIECRLGGKARRGHLNFPPIQNRLHIINTFAPQFFHILFQLHFSLNVLIVYVYVSPVKRAVRTAYKTSTVTALQQRKTLQPSCRSGGCLQFEAAICLMAATACTSRIPRPPPPQLQRTLLRKNTATTRREKTARLQLFFRPAISWQSAFLFCCCVARLVPASRAALVTHGNLAFIGGPSFSSRYIKQQSSLWRPIAAAAV